MYLSGKIEDHYLKAEKRLNFNFAPTNEAIHALVYFNISEYECKLNIEIQITGKWIKPYVGKQCNYEDVYERPY